MLPLLQIVATFCTGVFAGAAIYINLAEHPARMSCGTPAALAQWAPSYRRAARMQAPLALVGFLAAVVVWIIAKDVWWLIAAVLIGAVVPFTLIVIKPTNNTLLATPLHHANADTERLLAHWARLHLVRSVVSLIAFVLLLWRLTTH